MIDAATILVADDSADDVELLKRAIQKAGLTNPVRYVTDGQQAIDYLKHGATCTCGADCPLLLFLDLNMPQCTGFAVLDWLRRQPHLRSLPTIVFSNSALEADVEKSFRLGAHSYWIKPSRFEDLVKMMTRLKEIIRRIAARTEEEVAVTVPVAA
jgi:CheY-like chemotaxis protein